MNKRNFLTLSVITALALPLSAWATDYRESNPKTWVAKTVDSAIKGLYGDIKFVKSDEVKLKMPKISTNGGVVPVKISATIDSKSVSLFQNSNPESAVAVWSVPEGG